MLSFTTRPLNRKNQQRFQLNFETVFIIPSFGMPHALTNGVKRDSKAQQY